MKMFCQTLVNYLKFFSWLARRLSIKIKVTHVLVKVDRHIKISLIVSIWCYQFIESGRICLDLRVSSLRTWNIEHFCISLSCLIDLPFSFFYTRLDIHYCGSWWRLPWILLRQLFLDSWHFLLLSRRFKIHCILLISHLDIFILLLIFSFCAHFRNGYLE